MNLIELLEYEKWGKKMIKIIKPGKIRVITCPTCKCVFSYESEDIEWGDQRDPYKEVVCPCCANRIDLNVYKI